MLEQKIFENDQVILNTDGKPEYVIIPIERYKKLLEMLEDFGLGQAMLEAEQTPRLSLEQALALLSSDEENHERQEVPIKSARVRMAPTRAG